MRMSLSEVDSIGLRTKDTERWFLDNYVTRNSKMGKILEKVHNTCFWDLI